MITRRTVCRGAALLLLCCCCLAVSGCWDRKEIESRGYVLGIAIDMAQPAPPAAAEILKTEQAAGSRKYKVSYEMKKIRSKGESAGNPGSGEDESLVYAAEGESLFATIRAVNTQYPSALFFEDNQLLVLSEAVARDGVKDLIDFFDRDPEFRRRAKVFITPGRAEDLFMCKTKSGELISTYVPRITRNVKKTPTFATTTEVGLISEKIHNNQSIAIPRIIIDGDNVKAIGAALFDRSYKMVAILNEQDTVGSKILRRRLHEGVTIVPNPRQPDKISVFELFQAEIDVEPHLENGRLWFDLKAKFIGALAENQVGRQKTLQSDFLAALEQTLSEQFVHQTRHAYASLQKNRTDVVELGFLVHKKYPRYWKEIKERWDEEIFPQVPLQDVIIEVTIRNTAMTL
ncbi:MAG: Ger(x)C family spore germination protein [Sporomusaceae bacterium]|nr:Ger(x)C family spore germination protein [Sporomusaceae bacterium]